MRAWETRDQLLRREVDDLMQALASAAKRQEKFETRLNALEGTIVEQGARLGLLEIVSKA